MSTQSKSINMTADRTSLGLVLIGSFGLFYTTLGMLHSFGVLYSELLEQFDSGKAETSWISSLSTGLLLISGPVVSVLERKVGCRLVAVLGSVIIATGMFLSGFVPFLRLLYLTYGIICGIGFGFCLLAANVVLPINFDRWLALATAFASSGGAVGTISLPLITRYLLHEYGWRGTFVLLGGIALQGVLFGLMLLSPREHKQTISVAQPSKQNNSNLKKNVEAICADGRYLLYVVSSFFVSMVYFTIYVILPDAAKENGITADNAAVLITTSGISGLIGRIFIGLLADLQCVNKCILNGTIIALGGLATFGCPLMETFELFVGYAIYLGIFLGTFAFLQGVILADIVGKDRVSIAYGFFSFANGVSVTFGIPLAGWIADLTHTYVGSFYFIGSVFVVGGILSILIPVYGNLKEKIMFKHTKCCDITQVS